jgi:MFS family permease
MFRALRTRNYRLFASGQLLTNTGTWMQRVAQDWLVLELSNSGTALGLVTALQFLPTILFGLWGGVLADRYDKRRLMVTARAAMGGQSLLLGLLVVAGQARLWQVYVLAALLGLTAAVETPARQAFVVEMVGPEDLPNAVGLNSAIFNSARVVGPALAGLMINLVGTGWVFLLTAATSGAVILGLLRMDLADLYRTPAAGRGRGQLRTGLRYVRHRADLVVPLLLVFTVGTFGLNFQLTLALVARQVFHRGAGSYGLLSTCLAAGSLAGALLATVRSRRPRVRFLLLAAFAFGVLEALTGLMPTYWSLAAMLLLAGAAALSFTTACNSAVQMGAAPAMRGRVMALYLLCFLGGTPVGAPVIGWLAEQYGARTSLVAGGLICAVAAVGIGLVLARRNGLRVDDLAGGVRLRRPVPVPAAEPVLPPAEPEPSQYPVRVAR